MLDRRQAPAAPPRRSPCPTRAREQDAVGRRHDRARRARDGEGRQAEGLTSASISPLVRENVERRRATSWHLPRHIDEFSYRFKHRAGDMLERTMAHGLGAIR